MIPETKVCPSCNIEKSKNDFHTRNDKGYLYLKSYCKECSSKKKKNEMYNTCKCGNSKTKQSNTCSKCHYNNLKKYNTIADCQDSNKYTGPTSYQIIRSRARSIVKDITSCQQCGYEKHVEICHIKPISSFPLDTEIDVVNDINNLIVLCPNCHW